MLTLRDIRILHAWHYLDQWSRLYGFYPRDAQGDAEHAARFFFEELEQFGETRRWAGEQIEDEGAAIFFLAGSILTSWAMNRSEPKGEASALRQMAVVFELLNEPVRARNCLSAVWRISQESNLPEIVAEFTSVHVEGGSGLAIVVETGPLTLDPAASDTPLMSVDVRKAPFLPNITVPRPNKDRVANAFRVGSLPISGSSNAVFTIPGLHPSLPIDSALIRPLHYCSFEELVQLASECKRRQSHLIVHMLGSLGPGPTIGPKPGYCELRCFVMPDRGAALQVGRSDNSVVLLCEAPIRDVVMNLAKDGAPVVIKIDERCGMPLIQALLSTGTTVLILIHELTLSHLIEVLKYQAFLGYRKAFGTTLVIRMPIGTPTHCALLIKSVRYRGYWIAAVDLEFWQALRRVCEGNSAIFIDGVERAESCLGDACELVSKVVTDTFGAA